MKPKRSCTEESFPKHFFKNNKKTAISRRKRGKNEATEQSFTKNYSVSFPKLGKWTKSKYKNMHDFSVLYAKIVHKWLGRSDSNTRMTESERDQIMKDE